MEFIPDAVMVLFSWIQLLFETIVEFFTSKGKNEETTAA